MVKASSHLIKRLENLYISCTDYVLNTNLNVLLVTFILILLGIIYFIMQKSKSEERQKEIEGQMKKSKSVFF